MIVELHNNIQYYRFDLLDHPAIVHGVFTRHGGVSPKPWDSLNVGNLVGDERERVEENRVLVFNAVDRDPLSMYDVWQIHGTKIVCTYDPKSPQEKHIQADGIITNNPRVTLFMRFADCVPILLFDPRRKVIGLVHAGWGGTVKKIVSNAVTTMIHNYGSKPHDIKAGIGPSISVKNYPVGPAVVQQVIESFGDIGNRFLIRNNDEVKFDLWKSNQYLLEQKGVKEIEVSGICTVDNPDDWFSHRFTRGRTGRFGVLMGLT
jgi:YfiH family protein